jgi:hypothetical protein
MKERLAISCFAAALGAAPELAAQAFSSSNLPIVVISSAGRGYNLPVDSFWYDTRVSMGIIDNGPGKRNAVNDPQNNFSGEIEIRVQGSSSVGFPKRSFRISTLNAMHQQAPVSLLGMPAHEDWVLKALYQDKTFLRDDLAFRIHNQMGHYSSRSRFVEVVIDGEYKGVYQLLEKIRRDKSRVDISRLTPGETQGDDVSGGYIVSLDKFVPGQDVGWYSKYKSNASGDSANYFLFYYPKPDSIAPLQMLYIKGYFDQFEDALSSPTFTNSEGYRKYIDVASFIDVFIVNELSRNIDGYRASTFFYKDKSSKPDSKLKAGPLWDFNIAFGNSSFSGGSDPYWWAYLENYHVNFVPFWWKKFMSDSSFRNDLRCRYKQLRTNVLSEAALFQYIDQMALTLDEAQQRNYQKYPILGQNVPPNFNPPPGSYAGEIAYLKWWLHERLTWMDTQLSGPCVLPVQKTLDAPGELTAFPNPFKDRFSVAYKTTKDMRVKLELLDVTGKPVKVISEGIRKEGISQDEAEVSELPEGYYTLKMRLNEDTYFMKLIKVELKQ